MTSSLRTILGGRRKKAGFNLAEATLSLGLFSSSFLCLVPLLALGLKDARLARNERCTAQIAQTLMEKARQGNLPSGTVYFDVQGGTVASSQFAAFTAQSTTQVTAQSPALTQTTLRITPAGAPNRSRFYATVFPTPPPAAP